MSKYVRQSEPRHTPVPRSHFHVDEARWAFGALDVTGSESDSCSGWRTLYRSTLRRLTLAYEAGEVVILSREICTKGMRDVSLLVRAKWTDIPAIRLGEGIGVRMGVFPVRPQDGSAEPVAPPEDPPAVGDPTRYRSGAPSLFVELPGSSAVPALLEAEGTSSPTGYFALGYSGTWNGPGPDGPYEVSVVVRGRP
jgi:hypothetical protein